MQSNKKANSAEAGDALTSPSNPAHYYAVSTHSLLRRYPFPTAFSASALILTLIFTLLLLSSSPPPPSPVRACARARARSNARTDS